MKNILIFQFFILSFFVFTSYQLNAQGTFLENGILYSYQNSTSTTVSVIANDYAGDIVIPETTSYGFTVTEIAGSAFLSSGVTSVILPNSITSIGYTAFAECSNLTSVIIPSKVTSIQSYTFNNCSKLISVVLPEGITFIGDVAFSGCSSLESINIPSSVTYFGNSVFSGNNALKSIIIPNGISDIKMSTFSYCTSLTSITLPGSVTSLGEFAFYNCNKVTSLTVLNPEPPAAFANSFDLMDFTNCQLIVPIGSKDKYAAATGWSQFTNIVEFDPTGVVHTLNDEVKVYKDADHVVIEGADSGEVIQVYMESGTLINTVKGKENMVKIKLAENQIYFVQIGRTTRKVIL